MRRTLYIAALLAVALLSRPMAAQKGTTIEQVLVRGSADAMEVEIQTSGAAVAPNTQAIAGPDRIVVDFPGAQPSAELRALTVNRGALKSVRSGLFFNNPPITRIVLDLTSAQPYRISKANNAVVVKLGGAPAEREQAVSVPGVAGAKLRETALVSGSGVTPARVATASMPVASTSAVTPVTAIAASNAAVANAGLTDQGVSLDPVAPAEPPKPALSVSYANGMLSIRSEKATLSQVLYEVQLKTGAEIAIPAGAEREQVVADLGPAPARDVLGALLNGSSYNFIFIGNELSLERVILTRRVEEF
jgi:AMIN domain